MSVPTDGSSPSSPRRRSCLPIEQERGHLCARRSIGHVTLESVVSNATVSHGTRHPRLSGDNRYLVFTSCASNPPTADSSRRSTGPPAGSADRHDHISVSHPRRHASRRGKRHADISDDGGTIVFQSTATDLVDIEDRNGPESDVYAFDVRSHSITRVSVDANGAQQTGSSFAPVVSGDGRYVVFVSSAPLEGVFNRRRSGRKAEGVRHVYLRSLNSGLIRRISRAPAADNADSRFHAAVSGDGRLVALVSEPRTWCRATGTVLPTSICTTSTPDRPRSSADAQREAAPPAQAAIRRSRPTVDSWRSSRMLRISRARVGVRPPAHLNLVADVYLFDTLNTPSLE